MRLLLAALLLLTTLSAQCQPAKNATSAKRPGGNPVVGAARMERYLPMLKGKRVGMVVNHTSTVGKTHVVDTLLARGVKVMSIFAPEHGFRGTASDGEKIVSERDARTGVSILSLYGKNLRPAPAQLDSLDVVIFDIQDVGSRFYTYISTMHYVMEACAERGKAIVVLDRPNPNGHYVDGPVLDTAFRSFTGMHRIPINHGLTVGELALMINGERWLRGGRKASLTVIPVANYTHQTPYVLPIAPSPNLPNQRAVLLYPSLCLFEGTIVSVGRGTDKQFQVIGAPNPVFGQYEFTPVKRPGSQFPPQEGNRCYGRELTNVAIPNDRLDLTYLFDFFQKAPDKAAFFLKNGAGFDRLAGTDQFRKAMLAGKTEAQIRATWQPKLNEYKKMRLRYLLYL